MFALLAAAVLASAPESRLERLAVSLSGNEVHRRQAPTWATLAGRALLLGGWMAATRAQQLQLGDESWRVWLREDMRVSAIPVAGPLTRLAGDAPLTSTEQTAFGVALGAQLGGAVLLAASLFDFDVKQDNDGLRFTSMSVAADGHGATVLVGGTF